ncbi:MAG: hypothetical protein WC980_09395 [Candidatus Brocadiia bacterium]
MSGNHYVLLMAWAIFILALCLDLLSLFLSLRWNVRKAGPSGIPVIPWFMYIMFVVITRHSNPWINIRNAFLLTILHVFIQYILPFAHRKILLKWGDWSFKKRIGVILGSILIAYLLSAFVVFDFTRTADPNDEEYYKGRPVAYGPHPRLIFCAPSRGGFIYDDYDGREWPFIVYAPICRVWRTLTGHAPPHSIR